MTRLLVVYHDVNVADIETDELRQAGFEVDRCAGPIGGNPCPVLHGMPCWQVDEADVLVYDTWEVEPPRPGDGDEPPGTPPGQADRAHVASARL